MQIEEYLPHWAIKLAHGNLELGAHLPTRDSHCCSDAHIIKQEQAVWDPTAIVHTVLTDTGVEMHLIDAEVAELFYPPKYVSDVARVLYHFKREDDE